MILAFDTSTAACTAALFDGSGNCVARRDELIGRGHSERLVPMIAELLDGRSADEIEIAAGTFDTPNQVTPTYELWTCRRENWLPPFNVARRYERDREGTARAEP